METIDNKKIENIITNLLQEVGENVERDGLKETPNRVAKMYREILSGYGKSPKDIFKVFDCSNYSGIVIVQNIPFYSLCEHHMLPFFGSVCIAYKPKGKVLGLSKFSRLVQVYSQRLQTQENLTNQIADALMENLETEGCVVYISARHLCMEMRGVKNHTSTTATEVKKGEFLVNESLIQEFYSKINLK